MKRICEIDIESKNGKDTKQTIKFIAHSLDDEVILKIGRTEYEVSKCELLEAVNVIDIIVN